MATQGLPDLDVARVQRWCDQRVPAHVRDQVRVECDITAGHLTIVECRPPWRDDMGDQWTRFPIARLRYTKSTKTWSLYWRDRNLRSTSTTSSRQPADSTTCSPRSTATRRQSSGASQRSPGVTGRRRLAPTADVKMSGCLTSWSWPTRGGICAIQESWNNDRSKRLRRSCCVNLARGTRYTVKPS